MKLNQFNNTKLIHIKAYKRKSEEYNALIFFYQLDEPSHKVKRTINIPTDWKSNSLLKDWLRKKQLQISDFDLENPHSLAESIIGKAKDKSYEGFFAMSKNKKFINIEDIRVL